jgi:hypothetical protein
MAKRGMSVTRFDEIKRLIVAGRSDREIARSIRVRRTMVAEIRRGGIRDPRIPKVLVGPVWAQGIDWDDVISELGYHHPLKFIWEEKAASLTTYSNFWKIFYRKFPLLRKALSTPREFAAGDRAEVDWAGWTVEWVNPQTGEIRDACIFVGALCFSQFAFARAFENMKSRAFLEAHRRMYDFFQGVPQVTVPDNPKTAVTKCHLYDPDINPAYLELAKHCGTAIVPARPRHPKDKAIVEGLVKLLKRYFRWLHRRRTFTSIVEINQALLEAIERINSKPHSRFKVSRHDRWEKLERSALKPLPAAPFESVEWKQAILHPDCTVSVESNYYSAPNELRGKSLQVKISDLLVEIYYQAERVAAHARDKTKSGRRIIDPKHFPENSRAYYEATPNNLLSSARFLSSDLHGLVEELFKKDTLGHIRIVQGLTRVATKEINETTHEDTAKRIKKAVQTMRLYNRFRVSYFSDLLKSYRKQVLTNEDREINRIPGNEMLRYAGAAENCASLKEPLIDDLSTNGLGNIFPKQAELPLLN